MKPGLIILLAAAAIQATGGFRIRAADFVTTSAVGPMSLSAGGNSFGPTFSGDGRRIVFTSHAANLVTNDTLGESLQVFVRDLVASNTILVSVSINGRGGDGNSMAPVISSNGQFVVFASEAGDLVNGDTNQASDVFVRDLTSGTTRLVSVDLSGRAPDEEYPFGDRGILVTSLSGNPLISADGRWVFFESRATNLTSEFDANTAVDVFRRDLLSNTTALVTRSLLATQTANAGSTLSGITPDGRRAAFISWATDLTPDVSLTLGDIYVRDMASNATIWVSSSLTNYGVGYRCVNAALSENGRFVAFVVVPMDDTPALYLRDLEAPAPVLIATNVLELSTLQISADGRYIVFENGTNVIRFDASAGTNQLVNVTTNGTPPASGIARSPVITPDGNGVVFISNVPALTTNGSGLFQVYARDMAAGLTRLISVATNSQPSATNNEASLLAVARDFSRVAFDSTAPDLVEGDGNRASDVFIRDLANEATSLISRRETSRPRGSGIAHAFVGSDCVSADGRFVVFTSYDNDLLPGDSNARPDVFIRDLLTGTVVTTGFSTNAARFPALSADGRYVAYLRRNPVFSFDTTGGAVWRFDRQTGSNELVSASSTSVGPAISTNGNLIAFLSGGVLILRDMASGTNETIGPAYAALSRDAVFTPDGRFVLFTSSSALTTNSVSTGNLYAWDGIHRTIQLVSQFQNQSVGASGTFAVSGNSRFVAFNDSSIFIPALYRRDLVAGTNQLLRPGTYSYLSPPKLAVNGNGTLVTFASRYYGLLVRNTATGEEELIEGYNDTFSVPAISADGRFVVYSRRWYIQGSLQERDVKSLSQLFVRDRTLGITTMLSTGLASTNANAQVSAPVLAADGRTVVFHSAASDLAAGDYNDKFDVFVLKLGVDSDGDGMDDDWEVAYFGNLLRNGSGDFDGDGATDLQEFLAGTDPTNAGSIFRVLTVSPAGGGGRLLFWTGNPDRSYRAEFKDDLSAAGWTALTGTISWNGSTASIIDPTATNNTHRYYRAMRLP